jgi:TolB protein
MTATIRILAPSLLAIVCFAWPLGTFDEDSGVAETLKPGHVAFNSVSGEYAITGSGEIGGTSDGFHYVWKEVTGDVSIGADIWFNGKQSVAARKAALMIRQSLDPRAVSAAAVLRGDGQAALQYRPDAGAVAKSAEVIAKADLTSTVYMSLSRRGDVFTMSAGKRGKMGGSVPLSSPVTVTMNGPVYVGLAVASSDPSVQESAVFSNVYVGALRAQ